jgi:polysaccharide pyruvyl transferase WcaK-like protein
MDRLPQTNIKLALLNHVGGGNLGDDATLDAVAEAIKRKWPNAQMVAFSMNPDDTRRRHGLVSYPIRRDRWTIGYKPAERQSSVNEIVKAWMRRSEVAYRFLKVIKLIVRLPVETVREFSFLMSSRRVIKSFDLLIISGGGQLTEKDGPWGFPYTIFKWVVLARSAGVGCIFLNVGAGPLTQPLSRFFARRALLAAGYVSLRDEKSRALVHEIGFMRESRVCPDSVYGLDIALSTSSARPARTRSIVGVAPMPYPYPDPNGRDGAERNQVSHEAFIGKLANFASWLVCQSYALSLFGTDIGVDPQATKDLERTLLSKHEFLSPPSYVIPSVQSVDDVLATMSGMDYVVTCRFHGVIFAHLLNKPVLAIAHHPKVAELMADLGLSSYCVDIRDFEASSLVDRFGSMVVDADEIKFRMKMRLARNREQLRDQLDELFSVRSSISRPLFHRGKSFVSRGHQHS